MNEHLTTVPSRYRFTQFQKYDHVIGTLLKQFPRALVIDPAPLTQDTYRANIRSAIKAKELYNYSSSHIDEMLWSKWRSKIVVSMREDGMIVLGDAETIKAPSGHKYGTEVKAVIEITDNEYLEHICELLSARVLVPAPTFRVRNVQQIRVDELENKHDIAFMPDSDPNTYLII